MNNKRHPITGHNYRSTAKHDLHSVGVAFRPDNSSPLRHPVGRTAKRLLDISLALPMTLLVLPGICVAVKIGQCFQSRGPLFYRQTRSGQDSRQFSILKFRTMHVPPPGETDIEENPDKRIYPLGRILRKSKVDELPQFLNVLTGAMSVVGPRPHHFEDCRQFEDVVDDYALRSIAKPGITGLAQYKEFQGAFPWNCVESRVEKDLDYINHWSLMLDVRLIVKTANAVTLSTLRAVFHRLRIRPEPASDSIPVYSVFDATRTDNDEPESSAAHAKPVDVPSDRRAA